MGYSFPQIDIITKVYKKLTNISFNWPEYSTNEMTFPKNQDNFAKTNIDQINMIQQYDVTGYYRRLPVNPYNLWGQFYYIASNLFIMGM